MTDPSSYGFTGHRFRQRFREFVGSYLDTVGSGVGAPTTRAIQEQPPPARLVEDRLAEEEKLNNVDAKDVAATQGEEKLVLYPTYARVKPHLFHATHQHVPTSDHVDVDLHVHGQVSIPHTPNAPLRRKDRLLLTVARQISGLPPLPTNTPPGPVKKKSMDIIRKMSGRSSTATTPATTPATEQKEPVFTTNLASDRVVDEPESISTEDHSTESSSIRSDTSTITDEPRQFLNSTTFPAKILDAPHQPPSRSQTMPVSPSISPTKSTPSWKNSHSFPALDLATCHANLTERLAPFIARSVSGRLVTIKVHAPPHWPELGSREIIAERQFLTNEYGHFSGRLIISPPQNATPPDTWTITASLSPLRGTTSGSTSATTVTTKGASVQEQVKFIPQYGVSLISDIDDTVKHSSILSGARELFRNTFVRDLRSMAIEGVRGWYRALQQRGVEIHYVSNAPYQCWPIIQSFMKLHDLPRGGSVSLKQYSGMISGMWESPAEKKRAGVENIVRDFPSRKFILVGDSGELDMELYTEIALSFRKQVIGIFIRDVTTPLLSRNSGNSSSQLSLPLFFDTNGQPLPTQQKSPNSRLSNLRQWTRNISSDTLPTLSTFTGTSGSTPTSEDDSYSPDKDIEFQNIKLKEIDLLSPLIMEPDNSTQNTGTFQDIPLRQSKTPPPLPSRNRPLLDRTTSAKILTSPSESTIRSEPLGMTGMSQGPPKRSETTISDATVVGNGEDATSRVKRVENWKKRLARCRARLLESDTGVEIWTWRVGEDVEKICEALVSKELEARSR